MFNSLSIMIEYLCGMPLMDYNAIIDYISSINITGGAYIYLFNPQFLVSSLVYIGCSLLILSIFIYTLTLDM